MGNLEISHPSHMRVDSTSVIYPQGNTKIPSHPKKLGVKWHPMCVTQWVQSHHLLESFFSFFFEKQSSIGIKKCGDPCSVVVLMMF